MKTLADLLSELKRRRVFRVAAVYACVAFIIIQIIDGAFDYLHIPEWIGTTIIVLLAIGFPIAFGLAWAFDITDEGIVRAKGRPADAKRKAQPLLGNKALAAIAALAIIVAVWALLREPSTGGGPISSVAVLPLDNLSGDPEQEYFVNGIHDALISELSKISAITVRSRQSTLQYKNSEKTTPEITQELRVDALVEGSALLIGDQVNIKVQLVDSQDEHLWAKDYDGNLTDVISLHREVAKAVTQEIKANLTPDEEAYLASAPQVNPEAYRLYLQGWHFRNLQTRESIPKAVEYLEQAVELDPTFARAWAALAHCYMMPGSLPQSWEYRLNRMKEMLDKALELDPNLLEAHAGLGFYQYAEKWDFAAAEASFRRAMELDPDNAYALYEYGHFLNRTGRPDEALEQYRRGMELDPLDPRPYEGFAMFYQHTRQYEKELESILLWQEIQGLPANNSVVKCNILMQQGRYAEAAAGAVKAFAESANPEFLLQLNRAEWALGNRERVYAFRDSLRFTGEWQQYEQVAPLHVARFYAITGEKEKALSLLERAYEDGSTLLDLNHLLYYQEYDSLRAEPRFKALVQKMGLTEVFDQNGQRIR